MLGFYGEKDRELLIYWEPVVRYQLFCIIRIICSGIINRSSCCVIYWYRFYSQTIYSYRVVDFCIDITFIGTTFAKERISG